MPLEVQKKALLCQVTSTAAGRMLCDTVLRQRVQAAEHEFADMPCGIMDQLIAARFRFRSPFSLRQTCR